MNAAWRLHLSGRVGGGVGLFVRIGGDRVWLFAARPGITVSTAQTATMPAGFPANLRYDLVREWIEWSGGKATISWAPNDGCAAAPERQRRTAGQLIDRFGSEGGTFVSPKGESYPTDFACVDHRKSWVARPSPAMTQGLTPVPSRLLGMKTHGRFSQCHF